MFTGSGRSETRRFRLFPSNFLPVFIVYYTFEQRQKHEQALEKKNYRFVLFQVNIMSSQPPPFSLFRSRVMPPTRSHSALRFPNAALIFCKASNATERGRNALVFCPLRYASLEARSAQREMLLRSTRGECGTARASIIGLTCRQQVK